MRADAGSAGSGARSSAEPRRSSSSALRPAVCGSSLWNVPKQTNEKHGTDRKELLPAVVRYCPLKKHSSAPGNPARRLASCAPRHPLAPAQRRVMSFSPFIMLPTLFGVLGHIGFCFLLLDKWESLELVSG